MGTATTAVAARVEPAAAATGGWVSGAWTFTDETAVGRARRGDPAALEGIYRRFERPVYTLALRLVHDPHDAEEVLQDTFLEVMRSLPRFRGEGSFAGWVRRIAASKALTRLRRERVRASEELDEGTLPLPAENHGDAAGRLDLERALERLSPDDRAVLWLHDVEGYTHEEIAALFGRTASFSKSRLARAHLRLRELVSRRSDHE